MFELKFTDIGEGLVEAEILEWFVNVGDKVNVDDPIVEVQTDKAAVEITSPESGVISERNGDVGDVVKVGETLVAIDVSDTSGKKETITTKVTSEKSNEELNGKQQSKFPHLKRSPNERIIATPSVRKYARSVGVNLLEVKGSEKNGRITRKDVDLFLANKDKVQKDQVVRQPSTSVIRSEVPTVSKKEDERIPIRGLRKRIYENMVQSAFTIPHVTAMEEAHVDKFVDLRKEINETFNLRLTYLPFIVKIVVEALKRNEIFNATIDEEKNEIVLKKDYHIGIATATPDGLVVPVIHHADQKSIEEIDLEIKQLAEKAMQGKLSLDELRGSTFTITSTGGRGGLHATPIINYPEVAILGVHAIKEKPVILPNRELGIGNVMGLSLSFDHRVIDGEPAGIFMEDIITMLQNPQHLILKLK